MGRIDVERAPYEEYTDRQLAAIPLVILGISLAIIAGAYVMTGSPVALGFEFTGGTEIQFVAEDTSTDEIEQVLSEHDIENVRSVGLEDNRYAVQTQATGEEAEAIEQTLNEEYGNGEDVIQRVEQRSASFGGDTQGQALLGLVVAFAGMSILVALMFRTFVPSIAVVLSAFSDIMIPLALMNLLGIELTLGAVAALLMIIGYSVDSDILLNNHVLRRRGGFYDNAYAAMRTGVSMTLTSIAAMVTMAIVARVFGIPLLGDIALILIFGLAADLLNTYLLNMSLLRWYTGGDSA
ncbi:protein translocase subunit SecF [Halovenus sp. WSH3]|uniref:Protein-export membrane protein SecF n=1 Tax=Halovenus carboxidivorans TaxID=2692199 RepID=A0A6B0THB6_9EURY|nr:protein translocase subunit SecF [Halovenus carboxidivorans]MXR52589.1 protein translocase subunit SecF [Halovenus carboxidivorans]